ncbi:MAG: Endoribonuclease YbeY [Phycisphaerae bacterium]|nr:Endoribonuclease YbeY [Phycisphaerae bacterium]
MTRQPRVLLAWRLPNSWRFAARLIRVAQAALRAEGFRRGELSIAVVTASEMARLHRRHTGLGGATDVLTFDLGVDRARGVVQAEIVICAEVAWRVAQDRLRGPGRPRPFHLWPAPRMPGAGRAELVAARSLRHAACAELSLYVVHGILHLSGYDDHTNAGFQRMHRREDELLASLGYGLVFAAGAPRR